MLKCAASRRKETSGSCGAVPNLEEAIQNSYSEVTKALIFHASSGSLFSFIVSETLKAVYPSELIDLCLSWA